MALLVPHFRGGDKPASRGCKRLVMLGGRKCISTWLWFGRISKLSLALQLSSKSKTLQLYRPCTRVLNTCNQLMNMEPVIPVFLLNWYSITSSALFFSLKRREDADVPMIKSGNFWLLSALHHAIKMNRLFWDFHAANNVRSSYQGSSDNRVLISRNCEYALVCIESTSRSVLKDAHLMLFHGSLHSHREDVTTHAPPSFETF